MKIREYKSQRRFQNGSFDCNVGISTTLFSSLTSGLAIEDLQY